MFWILTPYQIYNLQIFTPFCGLPFTVLIAFFSQKFYIFIEFNLPNFSFIDCISGIICKNPMS